MTLNQPPVTFDEVQRIDYRYCVSYYRGKDKKRIRRDGKEIILNCKGGNTDHIGEFAFAKFSSRVYAQNASTGR